MDRARMKTLIGHGLTALLVCCVILTLLWKPIFGTRLTYIAVLIIAYVVGFMVLATSRMVIKMLYDYFKQNKQSMQNTYIYGTTTGIDIAKSLRTEADPNTSGKTASPL